MEPIRYIDLVSSVTGELPPLPIAQLGPPVIRPLSRPLDSSRIVIVTSAGVRRRDEPSFAPVNDLTFREIPADTPRHLLVPSHPTPVRGPGEQDVNVVYPYERLAELAAEGFIGGVASRHLSFLGTIKRLTDLVTELAPRMARSALEAGADAAVLVPL